MKLGSEIARWNSVKSKEASKDIKSYCNVVRNKMLSHLTNIFHFIELAFHHELALCSCLTSLREQTGFGIRKFWVQVVRTLGK